MGWMPADGNADGRDENRGAINRNFGRAALTWVKKAFNHAGFAPPAEKRPTFRLERTKARLGGRAFVRSSERVRITAR
jgi:hypothetical protein